MAEPPDAERRAARRAFIRTHHPDHGGDPEAFIAGLARFDEPAPTVDLSVAPRVFVVSTKRLPAAVAAWLTKPLTRRHTPPRVH